MLDIKSYKSYKSHIHTRGCNLSFIFSIGFSAGGCSRSLWSSAWRVSEKQSEERFNLYARTRLAARTALYLLTHISLRLAVFLPPSPLSPGHSAGPILSRDIKWPPRHLCSLLLISGRICICPAFRLLRIAHITRAKICARVYSSNNVTFINDAI